MPKSPQHSPAAANKLVTPEAIRAFFRSRHKRVIYFGGYGELGYRERDCVRRIAAEVLDAYRPAEVIVHCGTLLRRGGNNGIADVYQLARERGIESTGIHPSIALSFSETHTLSPYCDRAFFVADDSWGGLLSDQNIPSPTLKLHLAVSHELVVIGGGKHAGDELRAFVERDKPVRYYPAELDTAAARRWAASGGVDIDDPRGAASCVWESLNRP